MSPFCNILYASTATEPSYVNFFDLGTGTQLPTYKDAIPLAAERGAAGTIE